MRTMKTALCCVLLPLLTNGFTLGPSASVRCTYDRAHKLSMGVNNQEDETKSSSLARRQLFIGSLTVGGAALLGADPALAVERAVGAYEKACREAGNCLERGDWDAAVGWTWGGKERCDATDPKCSANGVLLDEAPPGEAVPAVTEKVTCLVAITLSVGREETGTLKFGLYGDATPQSVQEMIDLCSAKGLMTAARNFGSLTEPVALENGGLVTGISPGQRIQFGIPSQGAAYARSMGLAKAGDSFEPMPRPQVQLTSEKSPRLHDCAGLISIPGSGLGYAAPNAPEDEAYASAFQITASAVPGMDREGRKVIGQIIDPESMAFLTRLANLPTNKGLKGIIPGQDFGPPLLKTVVRGVEIKKLAETSTDEQPST